MASRKQRMAEVLAKSDFHEEALEPLREPLASTIHSFAWLIGKAEIEMQEILSHHFIQEKLINQHGLPKNAVSLFNQLHYQNEDPVQINNLLVEHQELF